MFPARDTAALALAALVTAWAGPADAAVTVYTTQASFLAEIEAAGGYVTDTFDDLAADTVVTPTVLASTGNYFRRDAGAISYSLNVGTWYTLFNNRDVSNPSDVRISPENASRALNFDTFSSPVYSLGANFFITDVWGADASGQAVRITITDINNVSTKLTLASTTVNTYRGFVSTTPIRSLSVIADKPIADNWATINNFTMSPVPEPSAGLLTCLGALGLLAARRRRTR